jgi:hypothetical protein
MAFGLILVFSRAGSALTTANDLANRGFLELAMPATTLNTDNLIAHRGVLEDGIAFIQKPFTIDAIAAKVREVLNQSSINEVL